MRSAAAPADTARRGDDDQGDGGARRRRGPDRRPRARRGRIVAAVHRLRGPAGGDRPCAGDRARRTGHSVRLVAFAVVCAAWAFPAAARAATITVSGTAGGPTPVTITVTGGPGADFVGVGQRGNDVLSVNAPAGATFSGSLVAPGLCTTQGGKLLPCTGFPPPRLTVNGSVGDGCDTRQMPDTVSGLPWPSTGGDVDMG